MQGARELLQSLSLDGLGVRPRAKIHQRLMIEKVVDRIDELDRPT